MKRGLWIAGAAVAAAAVAAALWAARTGPVGSPAASPADYPLEVGLRWTYRGAAKVPVVREVVRELEIGGVRWFEMRYSLPLLGDRVLPMRLAPGGVVTTREGREFLLVRLPMVKGEGWTVDVPGEKEVAECTVVGEEEVDFLGKRAAATKVEVRRRRRDTGESWTDTEWYARGVGLVRMQVTFGVRATFVLESFGRSE